MKRCATIVLYLLILNLIPLEGYAVEWNSRLVCYSMTAARGILEAGGKDNPMVKCLGGITRPVGIILDENQNLILVGERDPSVPDLMLDDLVVSVRTADSLGSAGCPGVSIDPRGTGRDPDEQVVSYFGGTENTHYGQVCFEADLLLKRMGFGLESTGLTGLPNEWELYLDRVKSGYRQDPWVKERGRSWFFPAFVRISKTKSCAILHACKIKVESVETTTGDKEGDSDERRRSELGEVCKIFANSVTENFDKIARLHPVLEEFRSLTILSSLMKTVRQFEPSPDIEYWLNVYSLEPVDTPEEISTLRRGESGLAYSLALSGGVIVCPLIYRARAGDPAGIRQAALRSRPSKDALTWTIPLEDSCDLNWPIPEALSQREEALAFARFLLSRGAFEEAVSQLTPVIKQGDNAEILLTRAKAYASLGKNSEALADVNYVLELDPLDPNAQSLKQTILKGQNVTAPITVRQTYQQRVDGGANPIKTPGWHPTTERQNLLEFKGQWRVGYGSFFVYAPSGVIALGETESYTINFPMNLTFVLHNRWEASVTLPLEMRLGFIEKQGWLLPEQVLGFIGGIGNITLSTRLMLLDGLWKKPSLIAGTILVTPWYQKLLEGYSADVSSKLRMRFGNSKWQSIHTINSEIYVFERLRLIGQTYYTRYWNQPPVPDEVNIGGGIKIPTNPSRKWRISGFGFLYERLIPVEKRSSRDHEVENRYSLFIEQMNRDGVYASFLGIGVQGSGKDQVQYFFLSLSYGVKSLWSARKWF